MAALEPPKICDRFQLAPGPGRPVCPALQRFFSSTMQNFSFSALLMATGLGAKKAFAASAAINWLLKVRPKRGRGNRRKIDSTAVLALVPVCNWMHDAPCQPHCWGLFSFAACDCSTHACLWSTACMYGTLGRFGQCANVWAAAGWRFAHRAHDGVHIVWADF